MNCVVKGQANILYCGDCDTPLLNVERGLYCPKCKWCSFPEPPTSALCCQICKNPTQATDISHKIGDDGLPTASGCYCEHCGSEVNWLMTRPLGDILG
mgnify:FL=1